MADAGGADQVELDAEAKRLRLEQIKAEARRAIADAEKGYVTAQLPTTDVKPLEGKVDVGANVGLVAQLVAYKVLHELAADIKSVLTVPGVAAPSVLIVEDRQLVATDWPHALVSGHIKYEEVALDEAERDLKAELQQQAGSPKTMGFVGPVTVTAAVGAAASIVGMFRSDYSITARDVKIGSTPLVAVVTDALIKAKVDVTVDGFGIIDSPLITEFFRLRALRLKVERENLRLKIERVQPADRALDGLRAEHKEAVAAYYKALGAAAQAPGTGQLKLRVDELTKRIDEDDKAAAPTRALAAKVDGLIARFDAFAAAVTSATTPGAYPPLVAAALRERLHSGNSKHTHVLFVTVEAAGGETITRRWLWGTSGKVRFLGGVQVSYLLLDVNTNKVVAANTQGKLGSLEYDLRSGTPGAVKSIPI